MPAFRLREDGIDLFVRLTPKAAVDALEGVEMAADGGEHFKARVRAVPEDGKANAALGRLVAGLLQVPGSAVMIAAGATSRLKTLRVRGAPEELAARVEQLAGGAPASRRSGSEKNPISNR